MPTQPATSVPGFHSYPVETLAPADCYKLIAGSIVPRPIAWVSSIDADGVRNLAPFSFFNAVSAAPPVLMFCPAIREASEGLLPTKDTLENIRATGEFVVNIVSDETVEAMNATAAQLPPHVDEFLHAGLTPVACERVRAPRVGEAKVAFECRLRQIVEISREVMGGSLVLGDILCIHMREDVLGQNFRVLPEQLRAVGRLAGSGYAHTSDRFELRRPG